MTLPVLYSFRRCPYAMRARLALMLSETACELREIKLSAKPASLIAASPKATVPVLVLADGRVIEQSLDIMCRALGRHDPRGVLGRDDPDLIAVNDGPFKHDLDRYKYPHRHGSDALAHRDGGLAFLRRLEERLACNGQLCGDEPGLADIAIMPFVRQFAATDAAWFAAQPLPGVQRWLDDHLASDLFASVMARYAPWQAGDTPTIFASVAIGV